MHRPKYIKKLKGNSLPRQNETTLLLIGYVARFIVAGGFKIMATSYTSVHDY